MKAKTEIFDLGGFDLTPGLEVSYQYDIIDRNLTKNVTTTWTISAVPV